MGIYFENRMKNPEMFVNDYAANALNILEIALDWQHKSIVYFEDSQENENNDVFWNISCEANERAKGLLDAYQIITNREVLNTTYAIKDEIEYVKDRALNYNILIS